MDTIDIHAAKTHLSRLVDAAAAACETGFVERQVDAAAGVAELPLHHRDPFDPLLIAQALSLPALLCIADPWFSRYTGLVMEA